jgi:hypothetical protein
MIFYTVHMICDALPVLFDRFLVLQGRSSRQQSPKNGILVLWRWLRLSTKPLRQASLWLKISSGPGRLTKHTMKHNMSPRHATVWSGGGYTRNQLGSNRTSRATTSLENSWSCLAFVRQAQSSEVVPFHVFQNPNGPWWMLGVVT